MSRCDFQNSQISVGVAGDDIMFHILVVYANDSCLELQNQFRFLLCVSDSL